MDGEEERFKTPVHLTPRLIWNDAPQVRPQTREVYLMNENLERDRGQIESAIVEAYDFWIRTGMPSIDQSFDHDGWHYEWCTDIIGPTAELAWTSGELPEMEDVTEKVVIFEHCPGIGTVYIAEPDEVRTLVLEALRRGEIGQTKE